MATVSGEQVRLIGGEWDGHTMTTPKIEDVLAMPSRPPIRNDPSGGNRGVEIPHNDENGKRTVEEGLVQLMAILRRRRKRYEPGMVAFAVWVMPVLRYGWLWWPTAHIGASSDPSISPPQGQWG